MATEAKPDHVEQQGIDPYRISVRQYERMLDCGVFPPMLRLELLGGILVENRDRMTQNTPHVFVVDMLAYLLRGMVGAEWVIREEKPIQLGHTWRPEPDVAAARGPRSRYQNRYPKGRDLGLLVEVSDSTDPADHGSKRRRYASAGVPVYWIARSRMQTVEVNFEPTGRGKSAHSREIIEYRGTRRFRLSSRGRKSARLR